MKGREALTVAGVVTTLIITIWAAWSIWVPNETWKFESLGTLFSGLAYGGLIVTLWIQLGEIVSQEKSTQDSLQAFKTIAEVLALGQMRDNAGNRIRYLTGLQRDGSQDVEGLSPQQISEIVRHLKLQIPKIEGRIEELTGAYLSSPEGRG